MTQATVLQQNRCNYLLQDSIKLNRPTLKGKCFTPKDGKWKSLSETSEVKRWRATIFA
jgi:hypothetical protein